MWIYNLFANTNESKLLAAKYLKKFLLEKYKIDKGVDVYKASIHYVFTCFFLFVHRWLLVCPVETVREAALLLWMVRNVFVVLA